jgi:hypothetical protein
MSSQRKNAAKWYSRFGVSDVMTLLHVPFSSIVMSFVVVGAAMSETLHLDRLVLALAAVFLALQGAHFLDETKGHHWGTKLSTRTLMLMGLALLAAGAVLGVYLSLTVNALLLLFLFPMVFFPLAYNLELWKEKFHNPLWFGVSWGALVCLGSFFLQSGSITAFSVLISTAIGIQSAYILVLYEKTKEEKVRELSWRILKGTVVVWNLIALAMLLARLT